MANNRFYDPFAPLMRFNENKSEKKVFDTNEPATVNNFLIRKDNNESVYISKSPFVIGSKTDMCDFVIVDNKYIGRNHAQIIMQDNACFFVDNNSTNKSYINGHEVPPYQMIPLNNYDEIKLANLPFIFYVE